MANHRHSVGLPVILKDTGEMGAVLVQLPPQANGKNRYRVGVRGRPAIPGKPQGTPRNREVDEEIILVGMDDNQKISADSGMRVGMRMLSVAERTALKNLKIVIRDDSGSPDHKVSEAIRYIEAITIIEGE